MSLLLLLDSAASTGNGAVTLPMLTLAGTGSMAALPVPVASGGGGGKRGGKPYLVKRPAKPVAIALVDDEGDVQDLAEITRLFLEMKEAA